MTTLIRKFLLGMAALLLLAGNAFEARAEGGQCAPNAVKYKFSTELQETTSTAFVTVDESVISFTVSSAPGGSCVIVTFAAEAGAEADSTMTVLAFLDGAACSPGAVFFVRSNAVETTEATRSMTFICHGVTPGYHVVRMKFKSSAEDKTQQLLFRTMTVQYLK